MFSKAWLPILLLVAAGCVHAEYDLELTPAGAGLERRLRITRHGSDATPEQLERLGAAYGMAPPDTPRTQDLSGQFTGRLPDDIGGYGSVTRWETPLGSSAVYVERFRGNDDVAAEWRRREAAADRLTDLLVDWLEIELRDEPGWPQLRAHIQDHFRRDLLNVSLYAWSAGLFAPIDDNPEPLVRAAQYLVERRYLDYDEIPALLRAANDLNRSESERLLNILRQKCRHALGGESSATVLVFLATEKALEESLRTFLKTTTEFLELERLWREELTRDSAASPPDEMAVVGTLLNQMVSGVFRLGGDKLTLALKSGSPAHLTNGSWSAADARLVWSTRTLPSAEQPPVVAYAAWDTPDVAAQEACFGKVVLKGQPLATYCVWYHGLTDAERQEWDEFLTRLPQGEEMEAALQAFRFRGEPLDRPQGRQIAAPAVGAIVAGLGKS